MPTCFLLKVKDLMNLVMLVMLQQMNQVPSTALLTPGFVVLLNSIGCSDSGQTLNINADDAAVAAAQLLGCRPYAC